MPIGNTSPYRSTIPGIDCVQGVWTGGGAAANCTRAAGDWNRGIASVNYNAATGKYLVTFIDVGTQIVWGRCEVMGAAGAAGKQVNVVRSTFNATAKTVQIEVWDTATPSLVDLAATDKLCLKFEFSKNNPAT